MPHRPAAAILILTDRPYPDRQREAARRYAEENGLRVTAICYHWPDCYAMVVNRHVAVVVSALDPGAEAAEAIENAGGRLCVVRQVVTRVRKDINSIAARMHQAGMDTRQIARILEVDSGEIRRSLLKRGIRPRTQPE